MMLKTYLLFLVAVPFALGQNPACDSLKQISSAAPGLEITETQDVAEGTEMPTEHVKTPAHCLVHGEVNRHEGADGKSYGDKFELRLPKDWNGRLLFQGGGGLDGVLRTALGSGGPSDRPALLRGYAVVSTDGGHEAKSPNDAAFGADPESNADYRYRSTQRVADAAKKIIERYYGKPAKRSYFRGCSNGGREGLIAAQRYPQYFDGVIAGAPAFNLTRAMIAEAWNTMQFAKVDKDLRNALSDADLKLVANAALNKCDALDGVKDGLIFNPAACNFDPAVLQCQGDKNATCLSAAQISSLKSAMSGPKDSHGKALYSTWPYDSGIAGPGWRAWILGTEKLPAINVLIFPPAINGMVLSGKPPAVDIFHFDFDRDSARLNQAAASTLNADSTNYAAFRKRGGKLILYTGMSDPVFSANDLIHYYRGVTAANGGLKQTMSFARLFLVPGMNHCGGGPALDSFDTLSALEQWVENDSAPNRIVAHGETFPGRTRPLCPFPLTPHYNGMGSTENAAGFTCRVEAK